MKAGATYSLMLKVPDIIDSTINIIDGIDKIIFTLENGSGSRIQKIYPDSVTLSKDTFILPLSQEDTSSLVGRVKLEAQVNYANSSVQKSYIKTFLINETLATEMVEGNQPDTTHNLELLLDIIGSDSLLVNIDPELSAQLIAELRKIYTNMQDLSLDLNEYVQLSKGQISQQTSSAMQDISKLTIAKLSDINDTAQAQVDTLNRTAQTQIEAINDVAKRNIETETNSIIQAAQNQIAGINKVASSQIEAINDTSNRQLSAINQTATSQIKAINDTGQAQSEALKEQGDGLKYDLAVKEKHTISLSAGTYSDLINVADYDAIQVNSISCGGTDTISEDLKLEVVKFKNGEQVGDEFLEKYNAIADLTDCDSIKLLVVYQGGISDVATVWYTLIVWDAKKEIERYVERVEETVLIKPTASGTEMLLNNSSNMPIQEFHLYGKTEQKTTKGIQLLNLKDAKGGTGEGVTYTVNADGSVARKGTATGNIANVWLKGGYYENTENKEIFLLLEAGKTYYIKDIVLVNGQVSVTSKNTIENNYLVTINENEYPEGFKVTGIRNPAQTSGKTYDDVIYPIVAESSTAVDWEEYTGGQPSPSPDYPQETEPCENSTVTIQGKNLYSIFEKSVHKKEQLINGITYTKNADGSITIKGKATTTSRYNLISKELSAKLFARHIDEQYTIKIFGLPPNCSYEMSFAGVRYGETKNTFTNVKKHSKERYTEMRIPEGVAVNTTIYPMVVLGDTITEYEPYKQIQTVTFNHSLNGIDDIRDELIVRADGTGTLIQRIYRIKDYIFQLSSAGKDDNAQKTVLYYSRMVGAPTALATNFAQERVMCNKMYWAQDNIWGNATSDKPYLIDIYSTSESLPPQILIRVPKDIDVEEFVDSGLDIQYKIKEPIVNELSADEVQKILALHTNKPNTTIWNDQNADMKVTYVADTKNYIDNKLAELQALTLEGGN